MHQCLYDLPISSAPITCVTILQRRHSSVAPTTLSSLAKRAGAVAVVGHTSGEISFYDVDSPNATLLKVVQVKDCPTGYTIVKPLSLESLLDSNPSGDKILALVGVGGEGSRFLPTMVSLYDIRSPPAVVTEIVMASPVINLEVGVGYFAVVSEDILRIYSFSLGLILKKDTCPNISGTVALAPSQGRKKPPIIVAPESTVGHILCSRLDGTQMSLPVRRHRHILSIASTGSVTACGFEDGGLWVLGGLNDGDPKSCVIIGRFKPGAEGNSVRSRNGTFYQLPMRRRGLAELAISPSEQFIAGVDGARCQIVIFKIETTPVRDDSSGSDLTKFIASKVFGLNSLNSTLRKPSTKSRTSVVIWSFIDLPQSVEDLEIVLQFGANNTLLVCGVNGKASCYAYDTTISGEKATLVWSSQFCSLRERVASLDSTSTRTACGAGCCADSPSTHRSTGRSENDTAHWDINEHVVSFDVNEDASGTQEQAVDRPEELVASDEEWVLVTNRGSAVGRVPQPPATPAAPPSGPFPLRNRVPRNWRSTETGCTLLSFCCWFLGGKDIARARTTCKMMLTKLEMGEIVEIAKSRGIRVTSVVMNGKEVKPTTAQLLRAMYRLETVYIEENFTASDWGKKWLRGPMTIDEQNQAVDLRECNVVEVPRNPDENEDPDNSLSPCPLASSKCLTILGPVNRACHPYSGVFLHTIRQHNGIKPRRVEFRCRVGGRMHQGQGCLAFLSTLPTSQHTSPYQAAGAPTMSVSQLIPRGGSLCPVASAFVMGFMENGISATGCPGWAYEPRKWYHIAVDFTWPSLEKCSCRNKRDRINDTDSPCELTKSDLLVTFWVDGHLVRKDARVSGDFRLLHNGFVACCIYNNSGHKAVPASSGT
ncbi:hypothetical protein FOL47_007357, partial [Perkinsus chesapeaki]